MLRKVKKRYSIIRDKIKHFKFKNSYSNNIGEENDYDDLEFVWGIKSWDDTTSTEATLYTMNDLDIVYMDDLDAVKELYICLLMVTMVKLNIWNIYWESLQNL